MQELFQNNRFVKALIVLVLAGSLYLVGLFVNGLKEYSFIGREVPQVATVSVSGEGESFAAPDIATVSFSVVKDAKTVVDAQKASTEKINDIMAFLKTSNIEDKDIKTTNYNLSPKYEWQKAVACLDYNSNGYCPEGKQILLGYTASQTITVKIRKIDDAGKILAGLGDKGATDISSIELSVDKKDAVQDEARDKAIKDAQSKAQVLARSLGVSLLRIVSYSEGGYYPETRYYDVMSRSAGGISEASIAPSIPVGQNQFTSNITIVYEIQ